MRSDSYIQVVEHTWLPAVEVSRQGQTAVVLQIPGTSHEDPITTDTSHLHFS